MFKSGLKNIITVSVLVLVIVQLCFSCRKKTDVVILNEEKSDSGIQKPEGLEIFEKAYPDLEFKTEFDAEKSDWKILLYLPEENDPYIFYWCNGSFLPQNELENKDRYWTLLYPYAEELKDPDDMTEEERNRLKEFSSRSNRRNGRGTPMFFFETIYKSSTRAELEKNLVAETFLGKPTNIHKRIVSPLKKVESRILEAAETDENVKNFVDGLKSADAYNWRIIDGTNRKSFHSLGIAIDVLPRRITGEIFWSWARDKNPSGWMLTPLSRRWMPPKPVVEIFEQEGFIWGGKWGIWDNMHFEYHPELILFNRTAQNNS